ncbi:MAG: phosphoribosyltransferase [Candidatus Helarchaeota archaeon]
MEKFEIVSWADIEKCTRELALKIVKANHSIDSILCLGRGGMCPSRLLSDYLNIPHILYLPLTYYKGIGNPLPSPKISEQNLPDLQGIHLLICDDVSDTGNSLKAATTFLQNYDLASLKTATLFIKPWTQFKPTFYCKITRKWIIFPWEKLETIINFTKKYKNCDKLDDLRKYLLDIGLAPHLVEFFLLMKSMHQY